MTKEEEQIKAQIAQAEEDKKNGESEGESDEDKAAREALEKENKPDYEAELKAERERRESAEKAAADSAFKLREEKRKKAEGNDGVNDDEDKPLTSRQLQDILEQERQKTRKEFQSELITEKARKLAGSDAEASLIVEIHKNRTFPQGLSLDEQIEEAYAIANRKTLIQKNAELQRALRGKETASDRSGDTYRESAAAGEPKLPPQDRTALLQAGFSWDGVKRAYKKPLNGGKMFLYNDPRNKRTWREKA